MRKLVFVLMLSCAVGWQRNRLVLPRRGALKQ